MDELDPLTEWHRIDEATQMGLKFVEDGKMKAVTVNGITLCLIRKGDHLYALRNRCPHSGGPLNQGIVDENGHVVCPWHRFKFCPEDGKSADGEGYTADSFPIEITREGTFVGFPRRKKWLGIF